MEAKNDMINKATVTKQVKEIFNVPYGQDGIYCEPSMEDICKAINDNTLEHRGFQSDIEELRKEWYIVETGRYDYGLIKKYHAERIAYFVVNGIGDPIYLKDDGKTISDGLHRLKAAIFKGYDHIEVVNK